MLFDLLDGLLGDSTVQCHKVHTVLCVKTYHIYKVLCRQCIQISLIVDDTVIDRNRSDHHGALTGQLLTEWLCVAVAGQIHDRLCAHVDCTHDFLHLNVVILTVSGYTKVYIDLGAKHASDTFRIETFVVFVGTDRNLSLCHKFTKLVCVHAFFFCYNFHLRRDDPFSCRIHLCCVVHVFPCKKQAYHSDIPVSHTKRFLQSSHYFPTLALSKSGIGQDGIVYSQPAPASSLLFYCCDLSYHTKKIMSSVTAPPVFPR